LVQPGQQVGGQLQPQADNPEALAQNRRQMGRFYGVLFRQQNGAVWRQTGQYVGALKETPGRPKFP